MIRPIKTTALLTTAILLAGLAGPAAAYVRRDESWGKLGVSYLQYRTDAVECAYDAETKAPVAIAQVDLTFMTDGIMPDATPSPPPQMNSDASAPNPGLDARVALDYAAQTQMHMNKHWRTVAQQLEPALAACLKGRGYQRFRLTDPQMDELKRLSAGTRARNVYLWTLAVDPTVLKTQAP